MSGVNRPLRPVPMVPDTVCKRTTCEGGALLTCPLAVRSLPWEAGTRGWVVPLAPLRPHPVIWNIPHDGELTTCRQNLLGGHTEPRGPGGGLVNTRTPAIRAFPSIMALSTHSSQMGAVLVLSIS